jgi:hypothetical protein
MVPGGSAGGMPGSGGWTGLAFAFFLGRGLAIQRHGAESSAVACLLAVMVQPRASAHKVVIAFHRAPR